MSEKEKLAPVVKGQVSKQKKSLGGKLAETFCSVDFASVISNCAEEVVIPAMKNLLYDAAKGMLEMSLWGEINAKRNDRSGPYVSYSSYSKNRDVRRRDDHQVRRAHRNVEDIFFQTRSDAENVLDNLLAAISRFGDVSVSDLNDLIGVAGEFTDVKYGWTNLSRAEIKRYKDGYLLVLPNVIPLEGDT